jgi:hypothetical protein
MSHNITNKVMLWGWTKGDCPDAVALAKKRFSFDTPLWFADTSDASHSFYRYLYIQPDFDKLPPIKPSYALSPRELIGFLERFSREKRSAGLDYHDQVHLAKSYFTWFIDLLSRTNISHALFELIPLTGLDYMCQLAAKRLGIQTAFCFPSIFPNRFFFCYDIEDFGSFRSVPSQETGSAPEIKWGYAQDLFYMRNRNFQGRYGRPLCRFLRETWRHGFRKSSKPQRMSGVVETMLKGLDFEKNYRTHAVATDQLDLTAPFVYFPLHLQPELTTAALGELYNDQLDALERLSALIPSNWLIYAKENPKQGCEQRGPEFFNRLEAMHKVRYVRKEVKTVDLLENAQFIATVTGTVGWEALLGGKPCLIFGLAWYSSMPGVVKYHDAVTVGEIMSQQPSQKQKLEQLDNIYAKTRAGIFDPYFKTIYPDYSKQKNVDALADFMGEIINYSPINC